jgi:hypothetical protein|tara:strand:- start:1400 stop:1690 length:291 start_codon:yes stop_codon:yes gene_type:complete
MISKQDYMSIRTSLLHLPSTEEGVSRVMHFLTLFCKEEGKDFDILIKGLNGHLFTDSKSKRKEVIQFSIHDLLRYLDLKYNLTILSSSEGKEIKAY